MKRFVIYYRVSTKQQGESGLGLEAQKRDIELYLKHYEGIEGVDYEIVREPLIETVSAKSMKNRPELQKAIQLVHMTENATLLVSKLDRLSRNQIDIHTLVDDQLSFTVASLPNMDIMQLSMYAMIAASEREFISLRTKAALKAKKERGEVIDRAEALERAQSANAANDNAGYKKASKASAEKRNELARARNALALNFIKEAREKGHTTYTAIANYLNELNMTTRRGKPFSVMAVKRIILKAETEL